MDRIRMGFRLAGHSWRTLRQDRSLAAFPLLGGIVTVLLAAAFFAPTALLASDDRTAPAVIVGAVGIYLVTFASVFFSVALAAAAAQVFDGKDATVRSGVAVARQHIGPIAGWAGLACSVNIVISALRERAGFIGDLVLGGIQVAWDLATFLAVPVIAFEGLGPIGALKRSASIFRERWGEQIGGQVTIGGAIFLLMLPVIGIGVLGALALGTSTALGVLLIAVAVLGVVALGVVGTCLSQIFGVALYRFATTGQPAGTFSAQDLSGAVRPRQGTI